MTLSLKSNMLHELLVICILVILNLCFSSVEAQADDHWYVDPISRYREGRLAEAKALLFAAADAASDDARKFEIIDLLLDQCVNTFDLTCINDAINKAYPLAEKVLNPELARSRKFWYSALSLSSTPQFEQRKLKIPPDILEHIGSMAFIDPNRFGRAQLREMVILENLGRYSESYDAVERAKSALFGLSSKTPYDVAILLGEIIEALNHTGNTYSALHWLAIADPYLDAALPHSGPDYASHLMRKARMSGYLLPPSILAGLYKEAFEAISRIDYNPTVKDVIRAEIIPEYAIILAANNNEDESYKILKQHPFMKQLDDIFAGKINSNPQAIVFAAVNVVIDVKFGKTPDARWKDILQRARDKIDTINYEDYAKDYVDYARDYIDFAIAVMEAKSNKSEATRLFISSALSRIQNLKKVRERYPDSFPLVNIWDRVIIELGILAASTENNADIIISGSEILDRNLTSYLIDAKSIIAAQDNDATRQISRTWIRRVQQRHDWEEIQLKSLLLRVANKENDNQEQIINDKISYRNNIKVERHERSLIKGLTEKPFLPNLARLQSKLKPGEAFIKVTFAADKIVKYCILNDRFHVPPSIQIDQTRVQLAINNLQNSLHKIGSPDPKEWDSYPIPDAIYLWETISLGLGDCLERADTLIVSLPQAFRGIPVESLIEQHEDTKNIDKILPNEKWIGLKWAISYADSAQSFIIGRELATFNTANELPYLGVGDPKLDNNIEAASIRAYTDGNYTAHDINLNKLAALPSTNAELDAVNSIFAGFKTSEHQYKLHDYSLLKQEDATELKFRSKPLSRYGLIHFATHAIITEKSPGITEPALVLTPTGTTDTVDDGILSASEISSLDLNSRIVILSACNSANINPQFFSTQLGGLSNAFAFAGATTIVASLWELDDRATKLLMEIFSEQFKLDSNLSLSSGRRLAIKQYISKTRATVFNHPRFWAPLIVLGDGGVKFKNSINAENVPETNIINVPSQGNVDDIAVSKSGIISSEMGPYYRENKRISSIIRFTNSDNKTLWSIEDKDIAASRIWADLGKVVAAGFEGKEKSIPAIRIIDPVNGDLRKKVSIKGVVGYPIYIDSHENIIHIFVADTDAKSILLNSISEDGEVNLIKRINFEVTIPYAVLMHKAFNSGPGAYFLTQEESSLDMDNRMIDEFGIIGDCKYQIISKVQKVNNSGEKIGPEYKLPGIRINKIDEIDGANMLISGAEVHDCVQDGNATVILMHASGEFHTLWSDPYASSNAIASFFEDNHTLRIFENIWVPIETFASKADESLESQIENSRKFHRSGTTLQRLALNIVSFNIDKKFERRTLYSSGLNDGLNGVVKYEEKYLMYGARAGQPNITALRAH